MAHDGEKKGTLMRAFDESSAQFWGAGAQSVVNAVNSPQLLIKDKAGLDTTALLFLGTQAESVAPTIQVAGELVKATRNDPAAKEQVCAALKEVQSTFVGLEGFMRDNRAALSRNMMDLAGTIDTFSTPQKREDILRGWDATTEAVASGNRQNGTAIETECNVQPVSPRMR